MRIADLTVVQPGLYGKGAGHSSIQPAPPATASASPAACYLGAMRFAATSKKLGSVPDNATVNAHVGIGGRPEGGFGLKVKLMVSLPGRGRAVAVAVAEKSPSAIISSARIRA
ncbi:organ_hyd_perox, peroxiredoxin, Ohr subfamily [Paracoccaceae bacterium]